MSDYAEVKQCGWCAQLGHTTDEHVAVTGQGVSRVRGGLPDSVRLVRAHRAVKPGRADVVAAGVLGPEPVAFMHPDDMHTAEAHDVIAAELVACTLGARRRPELRTDMAGTIARTLGRLALFKPRARPPGPLTDKETENMPGPCSAPGGYREEKGKTPRTGKTDVTSGRRKRQALEDELARIEYAERQD